MKKLFARGISVLLVLCLLGSLLGCVEVDPVDTNPDNTDSTNTNPTNTANSTVVKNAQEAKAYLAEVGPMMGQQTAYANLVESDAIPFSDGIVYRFQQTVDGIPVYGRNAVCVADCDGVVVAVNGNVKDLNIDTSRAGLISQDQAEVSVRNYLTGLYGGDCEYVLCPDENDPLVIFANTAEEHYLAYRYEIVGLNFDSCMLAVDARSGQVRDDISLVYAAMEEKTVNGQDVELYYDGLDDTYALIDLNRNFVVYDAQESKIKYELRDKTTGEVVTDYAILAHEFEYIFWSSAGVVNPKVPASELHTLNSEGVKLLADLQTTQAFYENIIGISEIAPGIRVDAIYDGSKWLDQENAFCTCQGDLNMDNILLRFMKDNSMELCTIAHEYTHAVEGTRSNMYYQGESGAIMEALSDIFGEMVEAWERKQQENVPVPDWKHHDRNIKDPTASDNPKIYNGNNWTNTKNTSDLNDKGGVHNNSTVLSHAAYLMFNDGSDMDKLNIDELSDLWYVAMLMMPQNCTFKECRALVEQAAKIIGLTEAQRANVAAAFDEVGVTAQLVVDYDVAPNAQLQVYDRNLQPYGDYRMVICGIPMAQLEFKKGVVNYYVNDLILGEYRESRFVTSSEPTPLNLEEGLYLVALYDNQDSQTIYPFVVFVQNAGGKERKIDFVTDFGTKNDAPGTVTPPTPPQDDFISISTPEELRAIEKNPDGKYRLTNDIDLSGYSNWEPLCQESPFTGVLDGNGYCIRNLNIDVTADKTGNYCKYVGLFSIVQNAQFMNLGIVGGLVNMNGKGGDGSIGVLAGWADFNYYPADARITKVTNCFIATSITATAKMDNQAGMAYNSHIDIGGFFGEGVASFHTCYNSAPVRSGNFYYDQYCGGFIGRPWGSHYDSSSQRYLPITITVENSYCAGPVTANHAHGQWAGGFLGECNYSKLEIDIVNSYYGSNKGAYSQKVGCAVSGREDSEFSGATRANEEDMKNMYTYTGFDFENTWAISPSINNGFPYLRSQKSY